MILWLRKVLFPTPLKNYDYNFLKFQLAAQYPDGWLEAGLRTNYPPQMIIGNNVVQGDFSGILEVYDPMDSGSGL